MSTESFSNNSESLVSPLYSNQAIMKTMVKCSSQLKRGQTVPFWKRDIKKEFYDHPPSMRTCVGRHRGTGTTIADHRLLKNSATS